MRSAAYRTGKALQLLGLLVLPSSLWVGFLGHDERGSITIFVGAVVIFLAGTALTRTCGKG